MITTQQKIVALGSILNISIAQSNDLAFGIWLGWLMLGWTVFEVCVECVTGAFALVMSGTRKQGLSPACPLQEARTPCPTAPPE